MKKIKNFKVSNKQLLLKYKSEGIKKVRFIASLGERTCKSCIKLNGKLFDIEKALKNIPVPNKRCKNTNCRCTIVKLFD